MGHVCFCVKLDLNLDGGHLPLGISPLRIEASDGNFSGVILPFGCLVDFYPRDRKGGFKTPKTTSDTLERLTQRTLMKEETTGSQMKTRRLSLASTLKRGLSCLSQ